jgi:glyoxylase-like metal-dependent hydrolase (beta-lactamase superfamily II)
MLEWQIGDVRIQQLVEIVERGGQLQMLPEATPENLAAIPWLRPHFLTPDGKLVIQIQMLVIETPARRMVVDTCIGNDKTIALEAWAGLQLPFLEKLEAMGHPPDSIDTVICTHLHVDHVGWNTRKVAGRWRPTFARARYLMVAEEFAHWRDAERRDAEENRAGAGFGDVFAESVAPVFEAGLVDLVAADHDVGDGVRFESTPGHTPGHVSVHVSSRGEEAVITGDLMHHPCQIARPDWATGFDFDGQQATATRRAFLERYADRPVLVLGTHFADPVGGRIVRDGPTYRLDS